MLLVPGRQVVDPSHVEDEIAVPLLQLPGAHVVPAAQTAQVPAPEQTPVVPQVDAG